MAYLRPIPERVCKSCGVRSAKQVLCARENYELGDYCNRCARRALATRQEYERIGGTQLAS